MNLHAYTMTYLHGTEASRKKNPWGTDRNSLPNRGRILRDDQPLNFLLPAFYLSEATDFAIARVTKGGREIRVLYKSPSETESNAVRIGTDVV